MRPMKREREAKAKMLKAAADAFFNHKGAMPTSKGYAKAKPLTSNPHFHIHFGSDRSNSGFSGSLTGKQKQSVFKLPDSEFYTQKPVTKGGQSEECKVRVGTTKPHGLIITDKDTGEEKYIKVPAKPRYRAVGLQGNRPKDGGK